MKCVNCGGALEGTMTFCPYCGVRQDIDLRQIHFRDMGTDASQPCPSCETPLSVIEFDTTPPMRVERCGACNGMFFNPGELEALLDHQTNPLVWLDNVQLQQISSDFGFQHEVVYRKCPLCAERMGHVNFGGRSGVVLDRCGTHGVWVEGGELRRLTEWWRAGGKLIFQQNEADKTKKLFQERPKPVPPTGSIESPERTDDWSWSRPDTIWEDSRVWQVLRIAGLLGALAASKFIR
ncbi:MAG: zf-TFIIB domain-containing protein [Akkermansiaceae bacterium]|nr:zf-TFIIB domain-containing protein [Akkermansiaceae bacterium]MCP5548640.1 zf-TFIIB domain-containing protein [Akkermansiaceae bacterium]